MSKKFQEGFGFIGLLLVLAIICLLFYKVLNLYFKKAPTINKETQETLSQQGINTANYKSIVDSTREKVQDIQTQHIKELGEIK